MDGPNTKLSDDFSLYEDHAVLKEVCRKGSDYLQTVNCKALWEIEGLHVKGRWICLEHVQHNDFWASPAMVIAAELEGQSGCPHCRKLAEEDVVERKEFLEAKKVHDERMDRSRQKSLRAAQRGLGGGGISGRYAVTK